MWDLCLKKVIFLFYRDKNRADKMRGHAALLLVLLGLVIAPSLQSYNSLQDSGSNSSNRYNKSTTSKSFVKVSITSTTHPSTTTDDHLLQDIKSVDETANNEKVRIWLNHILFFFTLKNWLFVRTSFSIVRSYSSIFQNRFNFFNTSFWDNRLKKNSKSLCFSTCNNLQKKIIKNG